VTLPSCAIPLFHPVNPVHPVKIMRVNYMETLAKTWAQLALLAGLSFWSGGCAAPAPPPTRADRTAAPRQPPPQSPAASDKRFIIAPELEHVIHVVNVRLTNPPGAYVKIQVTVENMTAARQHFSYRIDWFDENGTLLPLESQEFTPWMLLPHEVSSIAVTAPMPAAVDFGIAFVPAVP
jgi:uncharacterized protein YcfL